MILKLKIRKKIAKRLRSARKAAGLLQREVAKKTGLSDVTIRRFESAECATPAESIVLICRAVGADPAKIFGGL